MFKINLFQEIILKEMVDNDFLYLSAIPTGIGMTRPTLNYIYSLPDKKFGILTSGIIYSNYLVGQKTPKNMDVISMSSMLLYEIPQNIDIIIADSININVNVLSKLIKFYQSKNKRVILINVHYMGITNVLNSNSIPFKRCSYDELEFIYRQCIRRLKIEKFKDKLNQNIII